MITQWKLKCGFLKKSFIMFVSWTSPHHFLVGATQQTHQKVTGVFNSQRCIHNKWLLKDTHTLGLSSTLNRLKSMESQTYRSYMLLKQKLQVSSQNVQNTQSNKISEFSDFSKLSKCFKFKPCLTYALSFYRS